MKALARWSELVFSSISLLLWLALPLPPTARVMWNWIVLTSSMLLGITFFIWLKRDSRAAWVSAGIWAGLVVADRLVGVMRAGFPSLSWSSPAFTISFLLVYAWASTQAVVLGAVIRWAFQQRTVRALGA